MPSANTPPPPLRLECTLPWAAAALALAFAFFELTEIDLRVQDRLFDFATGAWRVDGRDPVWRALFYVGPKWALIAGGVATLAFAAGPARLRARAGLPADARADLWVLLLTLASAPALVGLGKAATNVFCPSEVKRYGGEVAYVKVMECYPEGQRPLQRGHCFPAGHASGGFALFALAGLARTRRGQLAGIAIALAVGGAMGAYQMAKGAHYLSHTVVTALLAWVMFTGWRRVVIAARGRWGGRR